MLSISSWKHIHSARSCEKSRELVPKPWLAKKVLRHGNRFAARVRRRYFSEGERWPPEIRLLFAGYFPAFLFWFLLWFGCILEFRFLRVDVASLELTFDCFDCFVQRLFPLLCFAFAVVFLDPATPCFPGIWGDHALFFLEAKWFKEMPFYSSMLMYSNLKRIINQSARSKKYPYCWFK